MLRKFIVTLVFWLVGHCTAADFDHTDWDILLNSNVVVLEGGKATQMNYASMSADRADLRAYLAKLAEISREEIEDWSVASQLAFLINAYNAWTIEIVLSEYPDIDLDDRVGAKEPHQCRRCCRSQQDGEDGVGNDGQRN
ncbi:MAG: hypothetical protein O2971_11185 [Proteobacteria bacterium]|nr:hypothetical protein [Pseudomonadota bacterium]